MKQSTKLLSLVLALVMAFSCLSVIGNAALVQAEVTYDNIDDADLTPEQVADLALDLVDNDLLAGMETIDLSIVGELRLNSIDNVLTDIETLTGKFVWTIGKGLLGDIGDMNFDAIKGVRRADGDLNVIYALLKFIADNAERVSKIAYGIGTDNGISLGLIGSFLKLDAEISDMLGNLPLFLTSALYDMLIYGSYNDTTNNWENQSYPDTEELGGMNNLPIKTIDGIVKQALLGLLLNPQDYTWEGKGENAVKVWDDTSRITTLADFGVSTKDELWNKINPLANSLFDILDNIAQPAIDKFGIPALNNNLKKGLMEACEVEFNEIDRAQIKDAAVLEYFDNEDAYVNYIAYDAIKKASNGVWYYTTMKNRPYDGDGDGKTDIDPETNEEVYKRQRVYYKANFGAANEFASLINWDWNFVGSAGGEGTQLLYDDAKDKDGNVIAKGLLGTDGTIAGGINWLLEMVYNTALTEETKADYEAATGGFVSGGNEALTENVTFLAQYVLGNFGDKIWGSDSIYANKEIYNYDYYSSYSIIGLVALIGPEFFEDAMPQILLPKNKEDGTYAFHEGVQLWEFAAIVLRELITGIAPNVNYDAVIFENGDVTSANDRLVNEYDPQTWFNVIVNMGMDLAYTYLNNITNFSWNRDDLKSPTAMTDVNNCTEARWKRMLSEVIDWAVDYVGEGSYGVLTGINPTKIAEFDDPIDKLNYILNTILPLGFVGETYTTSAGINLHKIIGDFETTGLTTLLTSFDLKTLTDLFGRNSSAGLNLFGDPNLASTILQLVNKILNLVFGANILQNVNTTGTQTLDSVVSQAALKSTVNVLLTRLNEVKQPLLISALPVVGKLISGWGTEQEFKTPDISLGNTFELSNGAVTDSVVTFRNASEGVWRHYIDPTTGDSKKDNQYKIIPTDVQVFAYDGTTPSNVTVSGLTADNSNTSLNYTDYGKSGSFKFSASNVSTSGQLVRFRLSYKVLNEDGAEMAGGKEYYIDKFVYLCYTGSDAGAQLGDTAPKWNLHFAAYKRYIDLSNVPSSLEGAPIFRMYSDGGTKVRAKFTGTAPGLSFVIGGNNSIENGDTGYFQKNNGKREWNNLSLYKSGSYKPDAGDNKDDGAAEHTVVITPTFDQAAFDAYNFKSGDKAGFSFSGKGVGEKYQWTQIKYTWESDEGTTSFSIADNMVFYDGANYTKLQNLVRNELEALRVAQKEYYNTTGTSYASSVIAFNNSVDENGKEILKATNYDTTAWVDEDGNVTSANADGAIEVTAIDNATAWDEYYAALQYGVQMAYEPFNTSYKTDWDFATIYNRLRIASNDVQYLAKTQEELVRDNIAVENNDALVNTLETHLEEYQAASTDIYNYTDYRMYRLNRFNESRDDANYYINLKKDASIDDISLIDEYFDYSWMEENVYRSVVANVSDAHIEGSTAANTKTNLLALLKTYEPEEIENKTEWLANRKVEYASASRLDIEMTDSLLTRTYDRLLKRDGAGTFKAHLQDEIASAENMIGRTNDGTYTETSWNNYMAALEEADAAVLTDSQKQMFDAKYKLLVERKGLVEVGEEADYTELEALIAQAEQALKNQSMYINEAVDFGMVIAELGMDEVAHPDGYDVQLFPGSAKLVLAEGYGIDDQRKVDNAANALKEALARLKFKGLQFTGANVADGTLVEADEAKGIEAVVAKVANIAANQSAEAVKAFFADKISADGASFGVEDITVSSDYYYTIDTDLAGFTGTNSTITFYNVVGGTKIPVATVKVVVDGDINGDGTVDVLDATYGAMVAQNKTDLSGCYLLAGDLVGNNREVTTDDYAQIVLKAIA